MTVRAIIAGFILAVIFAAGGRYVNCYLHGPAIVRGQLPITLFGMLIFFLLAVNPLLGKIRRSLRMKPSEIGLILALLLGVSTIIDAGLMRSFPAILIWPMHAERTMPGWQKARLLDHMPDTMLVNDGVYSEEVVEAYINSGTEIAWPSPWYKPWKWQMDKFFDTLGNSWDRIPWSAWRKPLWFWTPMLMVTYIAVIALTVIVHRQWARRERIKYPLMEIASSMLLEDDRGRTIIFRNKVFWLGFAVPFFISMVNLPSLWYPKAINIPMTFDFSILNSEFPSFMQTYGAHFFANFRLYPAAAGIAFLLASDIGFSLGISNFVSVCILFFLAQTGGGSSASLFEGYFKEYLNVGAFTGYTLILIYIGRRYYWHTAKEAFSFIPQTDTEKPSVWAARVFAICFLALVLALTKTGIPWHMALLAMIFMMMSCLIIGRLSAEAGAFFFMPSWNFSMVLMGIYGFDAIGPSAFLGTLMVVWVLQAGSFETLMPFAVNGLKAATDTRLKAGRVAILLGITVVAALAAALLVGIWSDYQNDAFVGGANYAGRRVFPIAEQNVTRLELAGDLDKSIAYSSLQRLLQAKPDIKLIVLASAGIVIVIALTAARLRWSWWMLHPVIILTFGQYVLVGRYGASLLLGWFIKTFAIRLTGASSYFQWKNFMIGVIAGDIMGGFVTMMSIWGYYLFTGTAGPSWQFW